jgi:pimeloyl-ACP methyl ester carboxylesterase
LLKLGLERAKLLKEGKTPWTTATGLVVRGYVSKIDGSVQPYGLVVPASYQPGGTQRYRLDAWLHGRGETLSEVNFLDGRLKSPGEFTPPNTFVLHPYGRYSNANKFAGEIDVLEALAHVKSGYPIDDQRLVVRGFSMGGASTWQLAVHYPSLWVAAAPGAGFAETPEFLRTFQSETLDPAWYEKKLWRMYDCPGHAINFSQLPVVAYSGEKDRQKQAADVMEKSLADHGMELVHILGPGTGHSYHPAAKIEINRRIDALAAMGRNPVPRRLRYVTFTLRYPDCHWLRLESLEKHWEEARVDAELHPGHDHVKLTTKNVSGLTLRMAPGQCPFDVTVRPKVQLDGQEILATGVRSDRSWETSFVKHDGKWQLGRLDESSLRKKPELQGPIDDAFMDSFVMVRPTGKSQHAQVGDWVESEFKRACVHWRQHFRGETPVVDDSALTDADLADKNLILWGDPASNRVLARLAKELPIRWEADKLRLGEKAFDARQHALVLIYPNPLNPRRYVVLNSGFTFREYDYLNNARQTPKLPDYAIVDLSVPPSTRWPGKIVEAGFFDERWRLE